MRKERRQEGRVQVLLSAEVLDAEGQAIQAVVLNVGRRGALIEHQGQVALTKRYDLVIRLPDQEYRIPAEAVRSSIASAAEKGGERYLLYRTAFAFQEPLPDSAFFGCGALGDTPRDGRDEAEWRALQWRQEVILTALGEGVLETDAAHRVVAVNPAALAIFERSEEELFGAELAAVIDPGGVGLLREMLVKLTDAEAPRTETVALPYGEKLLQVTATTLVEDGRYAGLILIVRDLTEVSRLREALSLLQKWQPCWVSPQELPESLQRVVEWSTVLLRADVGTLLLLEEETGELIVTAVAGTDEETLKGRRLPAEEGLINWVIRTGEPVRVVDAETDPRFGPGEAFFSFRPRSLLGVPLKCKRRILGILSLLRAGPRPFTDQDLGLLSTVALQVALALDHARLAGRAA